MNKIIFCIICALITFGTMAQESKTTTLGSISPIKNSPTVESGAKTTTNITKSHGLGESLNVTASIVCDNGTPCYLVKDTSTKVLNAVNHGVTHKQIMSLIKTVVTPQFDFTLMTRYALGNNWKLATPEQQKQLIETFKQLLIFTYSTALSKFNGATIIINNETINANKAFVVSLVSLPNSQNNTQPIKVEYDLAKTGENGTWKAYDIKIENASLVTTYRNQFNDIIVSSNINGLIKQLKAKVTTLQSKN